ncbi:MAG: hypothetical protein IPK60_01970 [Sandaracinaceae bacterium]|nr:hypothetical protein [Sandaracinaceae bacterium]
MGLARSAKEASALALALALAACGSRSQCAETAACALGTVCEIDGTCRPMAVDLSTRFARGVTLHAREMVTTAGEHDDDTLSLGGERGSAVLLAFADLPDSPVSSAELVLTPHSEWNGSDELVHVVVARVRPFDSAHPQVETIRDRIGERSVPAGVARPLRVDVTGAVRDAQSAGVRVLDISLRIDGTTEHALRYSLHARPRLELLVP